MCSVIGAVTLVGSGNLATHLGTRLVERGYAVDFLYSTNEVTGAALVKKLGSTFLSSPEAIDADGVVLICIPETAIADFTSALPGGDGLVVHTSGNSPVDLIDAKHKKRGVIWPLQSFSLRRKPDWDSIPLIIEEKSPVPEEVEDFAKRLNTTIFHCTESQRRLLHLAAVMVNNFANALFNEADKLVKTADMDFSLLLPLIRETADKLSDLSPLEAQTGPARRADSLTMGSHLELLKDKPELEKLYVLMSGLIARQH